MLKMNLIYILSIILVSMEVSSASSSTTQPTNLLISCGLPKYRTVTSSEDNRVWKSDDDPTITPLDINTISSTATAFGLRPPYDTARLFHAPLTYTFSLSPGPKFLRLYFTSETSYNNIPPSQFFLSLRANQLILFKNFSPSLNSPNGKQTTTYEFHLNVEKSLILTFSPGDGVHNNNYGFINAIEIVPIPQGLYINQNKTFKYLTPPEVQYTPQNTTAMQMVYRLNVGGTVVLPINDSGSMWRTWINDYNYLVRGNLTSYVSGSFSGPPPEVYFTVIPRYVAPVSVYVTYRTMGPYYTDINLRNNLTWRFDVDPEFDYLIRLHFCEMNLNITRSGQRVFDVYIDSQSAESGLDVWALSGGLGVPVYLDYVIRVGGGGGGSGGGGNGTKVPLQVFLHPQKSYVTDVLLNGVEILKLSQTNGNLAAPNPPSSADPSPSPVQNRSPNHHTLPIIAGAAGAVALFLFAGMVAYRRRVNKKKTLGKNTMVTNASSKDKWAPISFDLGSTTSIISSSLPSDLCRRFSFAQIRVATRDFDKSLIVGKGGFGMVYKGSIDGGATTVAVKRLNSTSKQGAREFLTEIEMLSRLRHVHLVSLIGFCEEEGEMILVYEYMPHGTLRDHLMYKIPEKIDSSNNMPLSWKQRLKICVGSARGLQYLHTGAKYLIIHRDVKSTNILLDDKWTAKVSDFGLSKVGPDASESSSTHISTAVKGSAGYLDPEYYRRLQLTEKSDVYSFGVVLFEVLCARAAVNPNLPREQANLAMWAQSHYKRGILDDIVDPNLSGQIAPESLRKFGEIADMCVRDRGSERPSMADVVWGLEFALQLQETAEKNLISGDTQDESLDSTNNSGGDYGTVENDVFSGSGDYFSKRRVVNDTSKWLLDSRSATSKSENTVDMKSDSVFSEIIDPKAR